MNYPQTIQYLYSQLPLFTRDGPSAYKEDLTNTIALCERLDNPQNKFKSVHVAGTNGKGSTSHMLAAILQIAGYKTGLYTSPHLKDFRERIRINGEMISEQEVIDFVGAHKQGFEDIKPSFFEMTVALAFDFFAREKVDIAIIEVGLGGRLDSTNIITPLLSVITNIGWDHMDILGNTLPLIAGEKAGIIKKDIPVVIGEFQPETAQVFIDKATQQNAPIVFASEEWVILKSDPDSYRDGSRKSEVENNKVDFLQEDQYLQLQIANTKNSLNHHSSDLRPLTSDLALDLTGTYQLKNIKTVLSSVENIKQLGFKISDENIKTALRLVKTLTGLHGRWEVLSRNPLTICDTGHNPDGIAEVLKSIASIPYGKLHFVMGVVNDKDISKILNMLPKEATYYFCKPDIPRGLDAESLKLKAESFGIIGQTYNSVRDALQAAQQNAGKNDLVFVGGSTFVVAEVV
jgi:dihydrofolate synthase / folylpolyglutamate synthase